VERERGEARRRRERYLGDREALPIQDATAILVDDGIATGLTMLAAIQEIKKRQPARIVVAVPVAPADTASRLAREVDDVVGVEIISSYRGSVSAYYRSFPQVSDEEVIGFLQRLQVG
jgi:predicted phosphoribosyltransferase